jgi:hypothetical protein
MLFIILLISTYVSITTLHNVPAKEGCQILQVSFFESLQKNSMTEHIL